MRFVLNLETELNINIDFANSIDDIEPSSKDGDDFGPFVQKLDKSSKNPKFFRSNQVDKKGTDQIYEALASDKLSDESRQEYIKFLIDFYVSKTHMTLEPVGYISGKKNHETFGISNIDFRSGMNLKDQLAQNLGIDAKFQRMEDDPNMIELLFDTNEES